MLRKLLISLFVLWHLTVLVFRNPVDIWGDDIGVWFDDDEKHEARAGLKKKYDRIDRNTRRYTRFVGTEQGWTLFGSPLARSGPWPALVILFEDETGTLVKSLNEVVPGRFLRLGMARQRKLEDHLASAQAAKNLGGEETELWEHWVQQTLARWKSEHPDDPRTIAELHFVSRRCRYLQPGEPLEYDDIVQTHVASYTPDAKLIRE